MGKGLLQKVKRKHGYTLMEVLLVVGIVAIICAIAIPSIISISRSLSFKQKNDYAKAIFMAAQANLTEMKDDSELEPLQTTVADSGFAVEKAKIQYASEGNYADTEYIYISSDSHKLLYEMVLPVGSVDQTIRDEHVIIELNPYTGNVYSVFYWEKDAVQDQYAYEKLVELRSADSEDDRKKLQLGYYHGSEVSSEKFDHYDISANVRFNNQNEGIIVVEVPADVIDKTSILHNVMTDYNRYTLGLQICATISGEHGGLIEKTLKNTGESVKYRVISAEDSTSMLQMEFPVDSLIDGGSFANLSSGVEETLTSIQEENQFKILPGDNVSISVDVTFTPSGNDPIINIESAAIGGVNPMFHSLTENPDKGKEGEKDYILAISNARNLQNLNALAPSIAEQVESVVFVENEKSEMRIDWGELVDYYNTNYGIGTNKQYSNHSAEAPARALPYFVPIQNANLFGKGTFADDATYTLQDINTSDDYAAIEGNGVKVYDLQINAANLTEKPDDDAYYAISDVDYDFTGLFSYVNTSVKDINIVNPKIIGADFTYANPATGALIGAAGVSTQVTGCGVYIDTADTDFDRGLLNLSNFQGANNQYGVSGHGAVGGLVGYARSERVYDSDYTDPNVTVLSDAQIGKYIMFSRCFASIPVYGEMRGTASSETSKYGYTNGVGGLIGNSQLTNFYGCYSSSLVWADGGLSSEGTVNETLAGLLDYLGVDKDGELSMGAGGFVGTSHGTCYTNCFASGNVFGNEAAGGFVGVMCYDAVRSSQHTVFSSCYAVGYALNADELKENFSGTNAVINSNAYTTTEGETASYLNDADFYRLFAPTKVAKGTALQYQSKYVFKDCYSMSQYGEITEENYSANCASSREYDFFKSLHEHAATGAGSWAETELNDYKQLPLISFDGKWYTAIGKAFDFFGSLLRNPPANLWGTLWSYYEANGTDFRFDVYFLLDSSLENRYLEMFRSGFSPEIWESGTKSETHAYSATASGAKYPFTMLKGMPYYGDWNARPSVVGMAYYEDYQTTNTNGTKEITTGYFYDREATSTLKNGLASINDGYAILVPDNLSDVKMNFITPGVNASTTITLKKETFVGPVTLGTATSPGNNSYYVAKLTEAAMNEAAETQTAEREFGYKYYSKVTAQFGAGEVYTLYFNPNVALSQINPVDGATEAVLPDKDMPEQIIVRTARQINAIGKNMYHFWTKDCNYVQQVDIDFQRLYDYTDVWSKVEKTDPRYTEEVTNVAAIGNHLADFNGTYCSAGEEQRTISGHISIDDGSGNYGIFGHIGTKGKISNLIIVPGNAENKLEIDTSDTTANTTSVGLLAGTNNGTIENVDILINSGVEVKAATATNFGLLVGSNAGTVTKSDVIIREGTDTIQSLAADEPKTQITVTGGGNANVGLLIGTNSGTLSECDAVAAVYAEAQAAETGKTESAKKPATINITGANVGLLAGQATGGTITDCDVAPAFSVTDTAAAPYYEAQLTVNATAHMFGGLVGEMKNTNVGVRSYNSTSDDPCEINLYQVKATNAFGGLAGVSTGSTITKVEVVFGDIKNQAIVEAKLAAGLIANADSANVSDSSVDLNGVLYANAKNEDEQPIGLAAGVIGTANGGTISDVRFTFSEETILNKMLAERRSSTPDTQKFVIKSNALAAGFVGQLNGGTIKDCSVSGSGTIFGEVSSAGFAVQTHGDGSVEGCTVTVTAPDASKENYLMCRNDDLVIGKDTTSTLAAYPVAELSAGFIVLNGEEEQKANSGADITNCMALGSVYGTDTAGFLANNRGTIRTSICNVNMASGNVFAGTNSGLVENCYGWSTGGRGDEVIAEEGTTPYVSSYFAVMSPEEDELAVVLYDADGVPSKTITDYIALMSDEAMTALMGFDDNDRPQTNSPWLHSSSTMLNTYAYTMSGSYPYPMLRHHYGDWAEPFGVLYYEKYSETEWGIHAYSLTDGKEVIDTLWKPGENREPVSVLDAGYAIYCRPKYLAMAIDSVAYTEIDTTNETALYDAFGAIGFSGATLYRITETNPMSLHTTADNEEIVKLDPRFADTFGKEKGFSVRTVAQLTTAQSVAGNYMIDRNIVVPDNYTISTVESVSFLCESGVTVATENGIVLLPENEVDAQAENAQETNDTEIN